MFRHELTIKLPKTIDITQEQTTVSAKSYPYISEDVITEDNFCKMSKTLAKSDLITIYNRYHNLHTSSTVHITDKIFHPDNSNFLYVVEEFDKFFLEVDLMYSLSPTRPDMWYEIFCIRFAHKLVCVDPDKEIFFHFNNKRVWEQISRRELKVFIFKWYTLLKDDTIKKDINYYRWKYKLAATDKSGNVILDDNGKVKMKYGPTPTGGLVHDKISRMLVDLRHKNWDDLLDTNKDIIGTPSYTIELRNLYVEEQLSKEGLTEKERCELLSNNFFRFRPRLPGDFLSKRILPYDPITNLEHEQYFFKLMTTILQSEDHARTWWLLKSSALDLNSVLKLIELNWGPIGNESKTYWINEISTVFGETAYAMPNSSLKREANAESANVRAYESHMKHFLTIAEIDPKMASEILKAFTGNDISYERTVYSGKMRKQVMSGFLTSMSNYPPHLNRMKSAESFRWWIWHWKARYVPSGKVEEAKEQSDNPDLIFVIDPNIAEKDVKRRPAMTMFLFRCLWELKYEYNYDLPKPIEMEQLINRIILENDNVHNFMVSHMEERDENYIPPYPTSISLTYTAFRKYCNKYRPENDIEDRRTFIDSLKYFGADPDVVSDGIFSHIFNVYDFIRKTNIWSFDNMPSAELNEEDTTRTLPLDIGEVIQRVDHTGMRKLIKDCWYKFKRVQSDRYFRKTGKEKSSVELIERLGHICWVYRTNGIEIPLKFYYDCARSADKKSKTTGETKGSKVIKFLLGTKDEDLNIQDSEVYENYMRMLAKGSPLEDEYSMVGEDNILRIKAFFGNVPEESETKPLDVQWNDPDSEDFDECWKDSEVSYIKQANAYVCKVCNVPYGSNWDFNRHKKGDKCTPSGLTYTGCVECQFCKKCDVDSPSSKFCTECQS